MTNEMNILRPFKRERTRHPESSRRSGIHYLGVGRDARLNITKKRHHSAQSTERWRLLLVMLSILAALIALTGIMAEL